MRAQLTLSLSLCLACVSPTSSSGRGTVVSPVESGGGREWSESERLAPFAIRNLQRGQEASYHLFRVQKELPPRVHQNSDLVLVVVAGGPVIALGNENVPAQPGTVLEIPRGTPYGVKNGAVGGSVLYGVFTPALDSADISQETQVESKNAWRWNLWAQ
jgi:mannose-6-phosphate isomerase-like protein (cupin superfamily)